MRSCLLLLCILTSVIGYGQIEIPQGNFSCQHMQKERLSYCIDAETYACQWTAIQIKGSDIEKQTYLPSDKEFFRELPAMLQPSWGRLEKQVMLWAMEFDSVYVVTGLVQIADDSTNISKQAYYKAILKGCQGDGLGFLFYTDIQPESLKKHAITLRELESITDMNFFPDLDPDLQDIFENDFSWQFWPLTGE